MLVPRARSFLFKNICIQKSDRLFWQKKEKRKRRLLYKHYTNQKNRLTLYLQFLTTKLKLLYEKLKAKIGLVKTKGILKKEKRKEKEQICGNSRKNGNTKKN